jgi:hypothetical protein
MPQRRSVRSTTPLPTERMAQSGSNGPGFSGGRARAWFSERGRWTAVSKLLDDPLAHAAVDEHRNEVVEPGPGEYLAQPLPARAPDGFRRHVFPELFAQRSQPVVDLALNLRS